MANKPKLPGREAYDGDYTDPRKSAAVDASYDKEYLERRGDFVAQAKRQVAKVAKAKPGRISIADIILEDMEKEG